MRAVIVDDEESVRTLTRYYLEDDGGFEIVGEADNGLDALELIDHTAPDVAVIDIMMPGLDGVEVIRQLRAHGTTTRLVAFSADPGSLAAAAQAGADATVVKSGNFGDLLSAISDPGPADAGAPGTADD